MVLTNLILLHISSDESVARYIDLISRLVIPISNELRKYLLTAAFASL